MGGLDRNRSELGDDGRLCDVRGGAGWIGAAVFPDRLESPDGCEPHVAEYFLAMKVVQIGLDLVEALTRLPLAHVLIPPASPGKFGAGV